VTITVNGVNDAPVAVDDPGYVTDEETQLDVILPGVLGNDTDAEGDPLTAVLDTGPSDGTLTLSLDGSFSYTPNVDFAGVDTFTYHANDGTLDSNVATVTITVNGVNDAPVAVDDPGYVTTEDVSLNEAAPGVLGNDTDVDGDPLTAVLDTGPSNGTLTLNLDGSFSYTPNVDFAVGSTGWTPSPITPMTVQRIRTSQR
jgi:VCBS repeat-containing protein